MSDRPIAHSTLVRILTISLLGALAIHFVLITVAMMPLSILGVRHGDLARVYVDPILTQQWTLFAPDPPQSNTRLQFQCRTRRGIGGWLDLASSLQAEHARTRISPTAYLFRLERAAVFAALGVHDPVIAELTEKANERDDEALKALAREMEALREQQLESQREFLYRLVEHHCAQVEGDDVLAVRARVTFEAIPKYSERNVDPAPAKLTAVAFDWKEL